MSRQGFVISRFLGRLACGLALILAPFVSAGEAVRVGLTASLSGEFAVFGREQLNGVEMWAADVNARGELLGRPVEIVHYDDGSDAAEVRRLYQKLISEDKVDLLLGPYGSDLTLVATEVAEQAGMPILTLAASAEQIWDRGYGNVFGLDTPASGYLDVVLELARERGMQRIAMVYADANFTREVAEGVRRKAAGHGLQIVLDREYPAEQREFSALAGDVAGARPDLLLGASYLVDSVAIVEALHARSGPVPVLAFTVGPAQRAFDEKLGKRAEGVLGVTQWLRGARVPRSQDFAYRYDRRYDDSPGPQAAIGYSAGQVLEAAARLGGGLERETLRRQFGELRMRTLLGPFGVDDTGRQIAHGTYLMQWQGGNRFIVRPEALAQVEIQLAN